MGCCAAIASEHYLYITTHRTPSAALPTEETDGLTWLALLQSQAVTAPCGHCGDPGQAEDLDWATAIGRGAIPKLTMVIAAPRPDGAIHQQCHTMTPTCLDHDRCLRPRRYAHGKNARTVGPPVPELAVTVVAPALDTRTSQQRQAMQPPGGDGNHRPVQALRIYRRWETTNQWC
jgi:hypothetical protein